ncbi:streptophobe family protein [Streptomyces xantholiticus]|uniref:Streptophobe family protein n=1 Tax=Streptomyces xantholiticus TaxID=68285 RepID=A0ABV1UNB9_9ACTN
MPASPSLPSARHSGCGWPVRRICRPAVSSRSVAALTVCLLVRLHAHYGLSLLGIGDLGGDLAGEMALRPHLWQALGLSAVWGLVTGLIGGLLASRARRRGQPVPRSR